MSNNIAPALKPEQIKEHQWIVADGVARIVNPYNKSTVNGDDDILLFSKPGISQKWFRFIGAFGNVSFYTNAPNGTYSRDAFEVKWQFEWGGTWYFATMPEQYKSYEEYSKQCTLGDTRLFLSLKPEHIPQVLTEKPAAEWADRYKEKWFYHLGLIEQYIEVSIQENLLKQYGSFEAYEEACKGNLSVKREWHLIASQPEVPGEKVDEKTMSNDQLLKIAQAEAEKEFPYNNRGLGPIGAEINRNQVDKERAAYVLGRTLEASQGQQGWISISEQMPEVEKNFILLSKDKFSIMKGRLMALRTGSLWQTGSHEFWPFDEFTHYHELPAPPAL